MKEGTMRKVYLEPNTDDDWGRVVDVEEDAPVQCWRVAAQDCYADQKRCHRGCAALGVTDSLDVICRALPDAAAIGVLVEVPAETTDHCQNCTVRGDLEACRAACERATSNPCDVPLSWGAAARISQLEAQLREREGECTLVRGKLGLLLSVSTTRVIEEIVDIGLALQHEKARAESAEQALAAAREENARLKSEFAKSRHELMDAALKSRSEGSVPIAPPRREP